MSLTITDRGERETSFGRVRQLKIFEPGYRPLGWREVWDAFSEAYPGRWAIQCFPPADRLVDGKAVYHLFVLPDEPHGLDLR